MTRPENEIIEIERHKYFLSEKNGYDVGWEFAEQDWEANFADEFRRGHDWHDTSNPQTATVATAPPVARHQSASDLAEDAAGGRTDGPHRRGGLRGLVYRLLNRN